MRFIDEYRDAELGKRLVDRIHRRSTKPIKLMEFCGGHTVSIIKHGIRQLLPSTIEMLSGPGCPVCVTSNQDLDKTIALAKVANVIIASFGDMVKVPSSHSSLQQVKAEGGDVRIVYSTQDALEIAQQNASKSVVFIGIGFETTAPTVAVSIKQAEQLNVDNYYILSQHKLCPPVMKALLDAGEVRLGGIICPGHVSAVIGSRPYEFVPQDYGIACVVSGFEPLDILLSVDMLITQIENDDPKVEVAYRRGVTQKGNLTAQELLYSVFEVADVNWRGIGTIPSSGLKLREKYRRYDAEHVFEISAGDTIEPAGCICGEILRGVKIPMECTLFRTFCNPVHPVGPCMVSSEGSCSAYYRYGEAHGG